MSGNKSWNVVTTANIKIHTNKNCWSMPLKEWSSLIRCKCGWRTVEICIFFFIPANSARVISVQQQSQRKTIMRRRPRLQWAANGPRGDGDRGKGAPSRHPLKDDAHLHKQSAPNVPLQPPSLSPLALAHRLSVCLPVCLPQMLIAWGGKHGSQVEKTASQAWISISSSPLPQRHLHQCHQMTLTELRWAH